MQTCSACASTIETRSRHTDAVSPLKALSQEPQSESMAAFVSAEVVRGPGVRRTWLVSRVLDEELESAVTAGAGVAPAAAGWQARYCSSAGPRFATLSSTMS